MKILDFSFLGLVSLRRCEHGKDGEAAWNPDYQENTLSWIICYTVVVYALWCCDAFAIMACAMAYLQLSARFTAWTQAINLTAILSKLGCP